MAKATTKKTASKTPRTRKAAAAVVVTADNSPVSVGNAVLIRTVTHYHTGRIVSVSKDEIVLSEASWIADTGRWSHCLAQGASIFREVEPYPENCRVSVNRGAIVDVQDWLHPLPKPEETK